jgi:hypothetical protein
MAGGERNSGDRDEALEAYKYIRGPLASKGTGIDDEASWVAAKNVIENNAQRLGLTHKDFVEAELDITDNKEEVADDWREYLNEMEDPPMTLKELEQIIKDHQQK